MKGMDPSGVPEFNRNAEAPDSARAFARLDVTLSNVELIVPSDEGLWPQVRSGLSRSMRALLFSVSWAIVGLCVVLPWALIGYGVYRVARRGRSEVAVEAATVVPPAQT